MFSNKQTKNPNKIKRKQREEFFLKDAPQKAILLSEIFQTGRKSCFCHISFDQCKW